MKVELKLTSDSHNTHCGNNTVTIEFFDTEGSNENVWITLDGREIGVNKAEFKKAVSII